MFFSFRKSCLYFSSLAILASCLSVSSLRAMEEEDHKLPSVFHKKPKNNFTLCKFAEDTLQIKEIKDLKNITIIYNSEGEESSSLDFDASRGKHLMVNIEDKQYKLPTGIVQYIFKKERDFDLFLRVLKKSPNLKVGPKFLQMILDNSCIEENITKIKDFAHIKDKIKSVGQEELVRLLFVTGQSYSSKKDFAEKSIHFLKNLYKGHEQEIEPYFPYIDIGIPLFYKLLPFEMKEREGEEMDKRYLSDMYGIQTLFTNNWARNINCLSELSSQYPSTRDFEKRSIRFLKKVFGEYENYKEDLEALDKPYAINSSNSDIRIFIVDKIMNTHVEESLKIIEETLSKNNTINKLNICLRTNKFNKEDFSLFLQFPQIDSLTLSFWGSYGFKSVNFPYDLLKDNKNIRNLSMFDVFLDKNHIAVLGDVLKNNKTLKSLCLSGSNLEDNGVILAEALKRNTILEDLSLSRCLLSPESIKAFGDALRYNSHLKTLDLSLNKGLNSATAQHIINSLKYNKSLQELWMMLGSNQRFNNASSYNIVSTLIRYGRVINLHHINNTYLDELNGFIKGNGSCLEVLGLSNAATNILFAYNFIDMVGKNVFPSAYLPFRHSFTALNLLLDRDTKRVE